MPRKKKAKPGRKAGGPNKSAFIRSQPASLKAAEVVAAAKAKGLTITEGLVYAVRSGDKSKGQPKGKPGRPKGSKNKPKAGKPRRLPKAGSKDLASFNAFAEAVVAVGGSQAAQRFLAALEALGI